MLETNERRPGQEAASQSVRPDPILSPTGDARQRRAPGQPPMDPSEAEWRDGYRHGYRHGERDGYERGQRAAWEHLDALQAHAASLSRMLAQQPSYADLAERRGEPERAAAQREILRQRGISLPGVAS